MKKQYSILAVLLVLLALILGGVWCWKESKDKEQQQSINQAQEQQMQENIQDVEDKRPTTLQYQDKKDLIWYEISKYNLRFQISRSAKDGFDKIQSDLKNKGESLVWYEVPELGIKFLVSPEGKEDLKYYFEVSSRFDIEKENVRF